jgi:hypothetical protein
MKAEHTPNDQSAGSCIASASMRHRRGVTPARWTSNDTTRGLPLPPQSERVDGSAAHA